MFVPFESINPSSRIWVYQSDKKFTVEDKAIIEVMLQLFTEKWAAHGQPIKSSFEIRFDQFIVLVADEGYHSASGCSIDDSVRTIQEIGKQLNVDLFNRNLIAFVKNESVVLVDLPLLKQKYGEGFWDESTPTFNNLIGTKGQLENDWIVPSSKTWLKRYVPGQKVVH